MDGNKSDDSFYDSDQDEQMAAASTQSLYDPSSPYTPVRPHQQRASQIQHTLSGQRLSSSVCIKATQSVTDHLQTQLSPLSVLPTNSFVKASCYYEEAAEIRRVNPNFVSEEELKQRESEDDQPEEPVDNRTFYVRLKEFSKENQFHGIDEAESDFLTQVDWTETDQGANERKEEQEQLQLTRQQTHGQCSGAELPPVLLEKPQKAAVTSSGGSSINKQEALARKRPLSTDGDPNLKQSSFGSTDHKSKKFTSSTAESDCPPPSTKQREELQLHCKLIAMLPGAPNCSNSRQVESELPCVAVFAGKDAPKQHRNGC
uniref:Muscular LMNA interacting protein n=1 Tax=Globodera pallida TaxID=36090 RepID=A0A183BSL5_GLOPA